MNPLVGSLGIILAIAACLFLFLGAEALYMAPASRTRPLFWYNLRMGLKFISVGILLLAMIALLLQFN